MKKCMIAEMRTRCGLENPPDEYDQNANECMNSVLKRLKSFKKLTVKETIELIQSEVENQQEHMKLARIGKGQWRICQRFKSDLEISEEEYSKLTSEKRKRYLNFRNTKQIRRYYTSVALSVAYGCYINVVSLIYPLWCFFQIIG